MRTTVTLFLLALAGASNAQQLRTFGTGLSNGRINGTEQELLNYKLSPTGKWGLTTHFWITGAGADTAIVRYYVDGELNASIEMDSMHAAGVSFDDDATPWGTKWAGKASSNGAFFHNYRIPFYSSLRVTYQTGPGASPGPIYIQVRGTENMPLVLEGVTVPTGQDASAGKARLLLQRNQATLQPLQYHDIVSVPSGSNCLVFTTMLSFTAPNKNTLEGCVHWYDEAAPGAGSDVLLATGTEDFYDSSYYFSGVSEYHLPVSGLTHNVGGSGGKPFNFSAYRMHVTEPLVCQSGGRMVWRNGDMDDPVTGEKCFTQTGGHVVGSPGVADTLTYGWVYVW